MTEHPLPPDPGDESMSRILREAEASAIRAEFLDAQSNQFIVLDGVVHDPLAEPAAESVDVDAQEDTDPVVRLSGPADMGPLLVYLNTNGVVTTHFGGGVLYTNATGSRPRIMFPHLGQIEEALRLFETLARHLGDDDMVQAIHSPVSEEDVGRGERLLHGEQRGFRTSGGRIVSFDNSWVVEVCSAEYERIWLNGLQEFDRPVPARRPVGDRAWRFTVYMPIPHAEALVRAAGELLARDTVGEPDDLSPA